VVFEMAMFQNQSKEKSAPVLRCRGSPNTGEDAASCKLRHQDDGYEIPDNARYDEKEHAWVLTPDTTEEELPKDESSNA